MIKYNKKVMGTQRLRGDEKGFASIVIALVLIIVLSLLTVGFAQLARREQQSALDKQLAAQANYAAESGINDVIQGIKLGNITDDPPTPTRNIDTTSCLVPPGTPLWPGGPTGIINSLGANYSCEIVNLAPTRLIKDRLAAGNVWSTTFSTDAATGSLTINWISTDPSHNNFSGSKAAGFLPAATWSGLKHPAVLQVSITPVAASPTRDGLSADTYTVYLYPTSSRAGAGFWQPNIGNLPSNGEILDGGCSTLNYTPTNPYTCGVTINGFSALPPASTSYIIRIVDYYDESNVGITNSSVDGKFLHSQAVIDSTGAARNVLKRLQAVVPIDSVGGSGSGFPSFGIQAQNICKRFTTDTTGSTASPPSSVPPSVGAACNLN